MIGICLAIGCGTLESAVAQEFANIEYLCADWGPAMMWSGKTNAPPQFSDNEEEVYFLKQVSRFTRRKSMVPNPISGSSTEDVGKGLSIYLCKMKPDGSGKAEIKELWRNPNYPMDTQGQSTWMDVNERTRKIALSITYAGNSITGLWTMNLDGSELKRIINPEQTPQHLQAINHPSWTPAGEWIIFEEEFRGMNPNRFNIVKCDAEGKHFIRLLEATEKVEYMQPAVSPDGKLIAFAKYPNGYPGGRHLWLIETSGANCHQLVNERGGPIGGDFPTWSPDGKRIYALSAGIIAVDTGQLVNDRRPLLNGKPWAAEYAHWGKLGLLGSANGFRITLTDPELRTVTLLAASGCDPITEKSASFPKGVR